MVLSITIAQTQIDATRSPSMTNLTIQCACQNSVQSDRSEDVSGSADWATSAGFMRFPLGSPAAPGFAPSHVERLAVAPCERSKPGTRGNQAAPSRPPSDSAANVTKLGRRVILPPPPYRARHG